MAIFWHLFKIGPIFSRRNYRELSNMNFTVFILILLLIKKATNFRQQGHISILNKIQSDPDLTKFRRLIERSPTWRHNRVTILAPTNEAFDKFNGIIDQNLTSYHILYMAHRLENLTEGAFECLETGFPPIWIHRTKTGEIYANNAKILKNQSGYSSKNIKDKYGKEQVLHIIDEVLNPFKSEDFWIQIKEFPTKKFSEKIVRSHMEFIYNNKEGKYTFFVPIDSGIDEYKFNQINANTIKGHIIRNKVLFLRPIEDDYNELTIDTMSEDIQISLRKFYNSYKINDSDILISNIPVKNGVIHLIKKPLGISGEKLTKFPYVEVIDKLTSDPYLNITYYLSSRSGFIKNLRHRKTETKKFTFFIPKDSGWKAKIDTQILLHPSHSKLTQKILWRHLIVSDVPYFMDSLVEASKDHCIPMKNNCYSAVRNNGSFYVNFNGIYIKVLRPDYECQDGIVHIVDKPFVSTEDAKEFPKKSFGGLRLFGAIMSLLFNRENN